MLAIYVLYEYDLPRIAGLLTLLGKPSSTKPCIFCSACLMSSSTSFATSASGAERIVVVSTLASRKSSPAPM